MSRSKKTFKTRFLIAIFILFGAIFGCFIPNTNTYAVPDEDTDYTPGGIIIPSNPNPDAPETPLEPIENIPNRPTTPSDPTNTDQEENRDEDSDYLEGITDEEADPETDSTSTVCNGQVGSMSWYLCPALNTIGDAIDGIYGFITDLLIVKPITTDTNSTFYQVWKRMRDITNIIFIIIMLIVIYSQVTGIGINNYGIKNILPRIIIGAILVNLSFIISAIAVDLSNIIGNSLMDFFNDLQSSVVVSTDVFADISWGGVMKVLAGGGTAAWITILAAGGIEKIFWIAVIAVFGAFISIIIGLITISLRQGVVLLLIMVSPLAFVAYLFPNTEKWYTKWKNLLFQMLFFFPMFSFLFGASKLAGWAIMTTAGTSPFRILLGLAVQVMPLFLTVSLLKMSGTILGKISAGLDRLSNPIRTTATMWGASHAIQAEKRFLKRNSFLGGARLRNYLLARQKRRELDTINNQNTIEGRATERALRSITSFKGYDKDGNAIWRNRPNSYTRNAKASALQNTRAEVAKRNLDNTLSEYGDIFTGQAAHRLSNAHAESYLAVMAQQFRAENIAQGDQSFLLSRYMKAAEGRFTSPYDFNRLIGGATGKMGHFGETTIMGQVVVRSAEIERRRKSEAEIVATKFGYPKRDFRRMIFDKANINDDGYELDEDGNVIEDQHYRYKKGMENRHRAYNKYIGVHKDTNQEITKEEYDALSSRERENYRKVRYLDITDDKGNVMNRVYEDDAGYMKTFINRDIAIGDPINMRYATIIGNARFESEKTDITRNFTETSGAHRRYHSTFAGSFAANGYNEHAAAFTNMLTTQLDNGYVTSPEQLNIAMLDSLSKAAKPGKLLQNDAFMINYYNDLIASVYSTEEGKRFEDYFTDEAIANYRNVNGERLGGLRLVEVTDENGNTYKKWKSIDRMDRSLTLDDQRNYLKHNLIAKVTQKLLGFVNRKMSPNILDAQKTDTTKAIKDFGATLLRIGATNYDESLAFEERINPNIDIFDVKDPNEVQSFIDRSMRTMQANVDLKKQLDSATIEQILSEAASPNMPHSKSQKTKANSINTDTDDPLLGALQNFIEEFRKAHNIQKENHTSYTFSEGQRISQKLQEEFDNIDDIESTIREAEEVFNSYSNLDNEALKELTNSFSALGKSTDDLQKEIINLIETSFDNT